jgi:hypothetical protein
MVGLVEGGEYSITALEIMFFELMTLSWNGSNMPENYSENEIREVKCQ